MSESESISQQLVAAREQKGVQLADVHRATGVSLSVLQGLESGSFDVVERVFVRLALSTYAKYLELDVNGVMAAFDAQHGAVERPIQVAPSEVADTTAKSAGPVWDAGAVRLIGLVGGIFVLLLLMISLFDDDAERENVVRQPPPRPAPVTQPSPPAASVAAAVSPAQEPGAEEDATGRSLSGVTRIEAEPTSIAPDAGVADVVSTADRSVALAADSVAIELSAAEVTPAVDRLGAASAAASEAAAISATTSESVPVAELISTAADEWLVLEIEAVDSTWVQVKWDTTGFFDAIVPPGQTHRWQARDFFTVHSGKAHGLRYTFQGEILGDGMLGDPMRVLRFLANAEGVVLLGPDFQPLPSDAQP